jgi:geranylgeranyl pyrophosphate synthase
VTSAAARRTAARTDAAASHPAFDLAASRAAIDSALPDKLDGLLNATSASLADPIRYALSAGGKRIRPALCLLAWNATRTAGSRDTPVDGDAAADGDPQADAGSGAGDVACAVELIHTYSLIHDDLPCMDDDDLRRGKPTVHRVFGTRRAALAGAALIPLACKLMERGTERLGLPEPYRRDARLELAAGAGGGVMVGGQVLDLEAEQALVELPIRRDIHARKTGALFVSALRLGALSAAAPAAMVAVLGTFGAAAGLSFQIVDDVLDETGSAAVLGKTAGKDRTQSKATFPALLGRDRAMEQARAALGGAVAELAAAGVDPAPFSAIADFILNRDR